MKTKTELLAHLDSGKPIPPGLINIIPVVLDVIEELFKRGKLKDRVTALELKMSLLDEKLEALLDVK